MMDAVCTTNVPRYCLLLLAALAISGDGPGLAEAPEAPTPETIAAHEERARARDRALDPPPATPLLSHLREHEFSPVHRYGGRPGLLSSRAGRVYLFEPTEPRPWYHRINVFDMENAALTASEEFFDSEATRFALPAAAQGRELLLVPTLYPYLATLYDQLLVYEVDASGEISEIERLTERFRGIAVLSAPQFAMVIHRDEYAHVIGLADFESRGRFQGPNKTRSFSVAGTEDDPIVALVGPYGVFGRELIAVHRVDPVLGRPERLGAVWGSGRTREVKLSPRGQALVTVVSSLAGGLQLEIRDPATAQLRSTLPVTLPTDESWAFTMAEGRHGAILVIARGPELEIFDLSQLDNPRLSARVPIDVGLPAHADDAPFWQDSSSDGELYVIDRPSGDLVLVDLESGLILDTVGDPERFPLQLAADDSPGVERLAVLSKRRDPSTGAPLGERVFIETIEKGPDGGLVRIGRSTTDSIEFLDELVPVGGRYVAGFDGYERALFSLDTTDASVRHFIYPEHVPERRRGSNAVAFQGGMLLRTHMSGSYQGSCFAAYPMENGIFGEPALRCDEERVRAFDVSEDTVYTLTNSGITSWRPPDVVHEFAFENRFVTFELSPDGTRALLGMDWWYSSGSGGRFAVFDLSTADAPRLLCESEPGVASTPFFDATGARVLASQDDWVSYSPWVFDTESCLALGEPGDPMQKYLYHQPGFPLTKSHALWRNWRFFDYQSAIYDVSGTTPRLVGSMPNGHGPVAYAPRREGEDAYLFTKRCPGPGVYLLDESGEFPFGGTIPLDSLAHVGQLRRGFLFASSGNTVAVLRDRELNRAPIARAGSDQVLECERGGADAQLDGRSSLDPDSTPGTHDDLASWRWEIDGRTVGDTPTLGSWLLLGTHEARLALTDTLGAIGEDALHIDVVDTAAPTLDLSLLPAQQGLVWPRDSWLVDAVAADRCEGSVLSTRALRLETEWLDAPVVEAPSTTLSIIVERDPSGAIVRLNGDPARLRPVWERARATGVLPLAPTKTTSLALSPARADGVAARYELDEQGRLRGAEAFGPGVDLRITAETRDTSGNVARAEASFRESILKRCAELPPGVRCRPDLLP